MKVEIKSKYNIGDKASWNAPYGWETVEITKVHYDHIGSRFCYDIKGYTFTLTEEELR